jgi:hypothetical protein
MTTATWVAIIIAIAAIAFGVIMYLRAEHSRRLKRRFGPEYDRLVQERGTTSKAERELEHRSKRVEKFHIRGLTREERDRYAHEWQTAQEHFVDDPLGAVAEADRLVHSAMERRGYPVGEFDECAADLSVDHPTVVEHYRAAHDVAVRAARNQASTEDLRVALKHYRALFEDLLGYQVAEITGTGAKR